ncbi:hypothetical protein Tco_1485555 [Tanacetum coccineum]
MPPPSYRGCWHGVSRGFFLESCHDRALDERALQAALPFFTHAILLDRAFAHCPRFPTAAPRGSPGRVSVPVWLIIRKDQLSIIGLLPENNVRLACVKHIASVPSEPGSNSSFDYDLALQCLVIDILEKLVKSRQTLSKAMVARNGFSQIELKTDNETYELLGKESAILIANHRHALDHTIVMMGFVSIVKYSREHFHAVYDLTLVVPHRCPRLTLKNVLKGEKTTINIYIKRFLMKHLPESDEDVATWCRDRFCDKDDFLDQYIRGQLIVKFRVPSTIRNIFISSSEALDLASLIASSRAIYSSESEIAKPDSTLTSDVRVSLVLRIDNTLPLIEKANSEATKEGCTVSKSRAMTVRTVN